MTVEKPVAEFWYGIDLHAHGIVRFREQHIDPFAVGDIWLVRGSTGAVAIDTGSGIVESAGLVQAFADKPMLAVALNSYFDHAGGWADYPQRACHPSDAPALAEPDAENASYADYLNEKTLWALPRPRFDLARFSMRSARATRLVEDGDRLDLGDRVLEVLHLPGRSPGGLGIWEAATGSLFTGDMLYDGSHGPAWPPDDPHAYARSLRRMRDLKPARVYPGHYGPMDADTANRVIRRQLADLCGERS